MPVRFIYASEPAIAPLAELDTVALRAPVDALEAGGTLQAGAQGTIVAVLGQGSRYLVEFAEPFPALVEVDGDGVDVIEGQGRDDLLAGRMAHRAS